MNILVAIIWFLVNLFFLTYAIANLFICLAGYMKILCNLTAILVKTGSGKTSVNVKFSEIIYIYMDIIVTILTLTSFVFWFKYVW